MSTATGKRSPEPQPLRWARMLCVVLAACGPAVMQPPPPTAEKPASAEDIDAAYRQVLDRHVDLAGRVDYAAWNASAADKAILERYVDALLSQPEAERGLAGWLNLYNGLVLREIVRRWPVSSVRDIASDGAIYSGGGRGLLYDLTFDVNGTPMSLLDIETRVIRERFGDPRAHFALNCGTRSCPMLLGEPFTAVALERRLEQATRAFVNHADNVQVDHDARTVSLSPIFSWYQADFVALVEARHGTPAPTIIDFVLSYADPALQAELSRARARGYRIVWQPYDWAVNGIAVSAALSEPPAPLVSQQPEPMPALRLTTLHGEPWSPDDARGRVVLLDFWATWCRPCLRAFPRYAELQRAYEPKGFLVVAVAEDEQQAPVEAFVRANQTAIAVVLDLDHAAAAPPLSILKLPTVLLIDKQGQVRHRYEGYSEVDLDQLDGVIQSLLDEP